MEASDESTVDWA